MTRAHPRKAPRAARGFTLIELLIVLMIIGLLLHGRLGAWQQAVATGDVPVKLLRLVVAYAALVLVLLLAIFALMGAKPA
jgi:prepilin-type N-terminal cleavage/methylation domain-containing protein